MLIEIWERILGGLEIPDTSVTLLGIDYEKAFNRMSHNECLSQLAQLGASQELVDIVASFLTRRCMQTRVNSTMGPRRTIAAGSPQGSILGCFLYCITTQQLGTGLAELNGQAESMTQQESVTIAVENSSGSNNGWVSTCSGSEEEETVSGEEEGPISGGMEVTSTPTHTPTAGNAIRVENPEDLGMDNDSSGHEQISGLENQITEAEDSCLGPNARFERIRPRRIETSSEEEPSSEDSFNTARNASVDVCEFLVEVFKYIDDTTVVEAVDTSSSQRHISTATTIATSKARYTDLVANSICTRADQIGMKVNGKKTPLLMVSPPNGCDNRAYINMNGDRIDSMDNLKLLGFVFGREPNVREHVAEIKRKFRSRFWSMIHLRRAGFKGDQLLKLFNIFLRPVIEFCCVVYHPLLTATQSDEIERMQKQVVKLAYGYEKSYATICTERNISTLKQRREERVDRFAQKSLKNPRFAPTWYPDRAYEGPNIRSLRRIQEARARTTRFFNSPLANLRRRANTLEQ